MAARCDVPLEQIRALAEILMLRKPVGFLLGWGLHRWEYAHTSIRAIDALGAVVGSIGVPGGGVSQGFEEYQPYDARIWGDALNPASRRLLMPLLAQELERATPPIQMIMVTAGNPLVMLPNARRVKAAFDRIPFKVVVGHFLDDTANEADLFLPATTFLEEKDVVASYGHSFLGPVKQAIDPVGKAKSDFQIFMELGQRFEFADKYVKSLEEWLALILTPTLTAQTTLADIFDGGFFQRDIPHVPYTDKIFATNSSRFKLLSSFELPERPYESGQFALMSTAPFKWLCSELNPRQFKGPLPVQMSTAQAEALGIDNGELCHVYNELGCLTCQMRHVSGQRDDLVVVPRGGWDSLSCNVNVLTMDMVSKVGKGTPYYETRVRVRPRETQD
jgi:anaerobic selenocysteine-containing dehydrogenase